MSGDIYTALAAVMADCTSVAKRDRNTHANFMFRGIDAVVNAVGPILRTHQVTVVPLLQSVTYEVVQTTTGKPSTACRVVVTYRFSALDGSHIDATVAGEAWDSGDKATPKAMSVAFRTALLQALALPTDEADPDSQTYERANALAPGSRPASQEQVDLMKALFDKAGVVSDADRGAYVVAQIDRNVGGFGELTVTEAARVIDALKELAKEVPNA